MYGSKLIRHSLSCKDMLICWNNKRKFFYTKDRQIMYTNWPINYTAYCHVPPTIGRLVRDMSGGFTSTRNQRVGWNLQPCHGSMIHEVLFQAGNHSISCVISGRFLVDYKNAHQDLPQTHIHFICLIKEHGYLMLTLTMYPTTTGPMVGRNIIPLTNTWHWLSAYRAQNRFWLFRAGVILNTNVCHERI